MHKLLSRVMVVLLVMVLGDIAHAQVTPIQNNYSRDNLFDATEGKRYYSITVPSGYSRLRVQTRSSDDGDCDVFVRLGSLPTIGTYDARSIQSGNNEEVTVQNPLPGTWYVMLYAYSGYFGLHLEVLYDGTINTNVSPGNKVWDVSLGGSMSSSPCLAPDGTIYAATSEGELWAIQSSGVALWHQSVGNLKAAPTLAADGTIYVVRETGQLKALSSSGTTKWTFAITTHPSYPVALSTDGTIYVPEIGNALLAINPDGTLKWKFTVESGYIACSPPVVGKDGTIYGGFYNSNSRLGRVYAVRPDGTARWSFPVAGKIDTPAIDSEGSIIFGSPNPTKKVYAIRANGTQKWESTVSGGVYYSDCYIFSAPVVGTDGTVYISSNRRLIALSPSDGKVKWNFDTDVLLVEFDTPNGPALDSTGNIYFGSLGIFGSGNLYAVKPDGTLAWRYDAGGEVASPLIITPDGNVIFATESGTRKLFAVKASGEPSGSVWPVSRQNGANTGSLQVEGVRPRLTVKRDGNQLIFTWQAIPGFVLEFAPTVITSVWTPVVGTPVLAGNRYTLIIPTPIGSRFSTTFRYYRLRMP
jgi:outer membrane protein assembly factor BamB